jgi:hypothetical protein
MPRRQRPLIRDSDTVRDASLIVIASEDTHAVERYFDRFRPRRVQFRYLPAEEGRSSPKAIVDRLDAYQAEFEIGEDDKLWYCGDIDHWADGNHLANLNRVLSHCHSQKYDVALSNPCFELWLLLHFDETPITPVDCKSVVERLRAAAGGYSKPNGCVAEITVKHVQQAIARAEGGDTAHGLPINPATQIYRIVKSMADRQSIVL